MDPQVTGTQWGVYLSGLQGGLQLLQLLLMNFPEEGDLVQQRLHSLLQLQAHQGGVVHVLPVALQGVLRLLAQLGLLLELLPHALQRVVHLHAVHVHLAPLVRQLLHARPQLADLLLVQLVQAGGLVVALPQHGDLRLQDPVLLLQVVHFLYEGHEAVVEALQLLLLVGADDLELVGDRGGLGQVHRGVHGGEDAAGSRCPAVAGGGHHGGGTVGAVAAAAVSRRVHAGRAAAAAHTHAAGPGGISEDLPIGAAAVNVAGVTHGSFLLVVSGPTALNGRECVWSLGVCEGECVRAREKVRCE